MTPFGKAMARSVFSALLALGTLTAADLSKYRNFQLGSDVSTVAKQTGTEPSQVKVIHSRPALIQELAWRPQSLGPSSSDESAKDISFSFYQGELVRIVVKYDRYQTEGLTADDLVESISAIYGVPAKPANPTRAVTEADGEDGQVVGQWQDSQYRFDLIRFSYGPTFTLIGTLKRTEKAYQAAFVEGTRLDFADAPQKEAERIARENVTERDKLLKLRLANKSRFRP